MNELVVKDEQYEHFLGEIRSTIDAFQRLDAHNRVRFYYNVGKTLDEYEKRRQTNITELIKQVHEDTGLHVRNLWYAKEIVVRCPKWEQVEQILLEYRNWSGMKLYLGEKAAIPTEKGPEEIATYIMKKYGKAKAKEIAEHILKHV